jgi:hypothetical protein
MTTSLKNIRHDLDPVLVATNVELKVKQYEKQRDTKLDEEVKIHEKYALALKNGSAKNWGKPRVDLEKDLKEIKDIYDNFIDKEINHYSKVRVIELHEDSEVFKEYGRAFVLVYGDIDDQDVVCGTGSNSSFEKSASCFLNGGR